jgi:hypothetical protein
MKISEETEKAIATRLGISKPAIPAEILKHREQTATFIKACDDYNAPRLNEWRATPAENYGRILTAIKTLEDLAGLYVPTDEIIALASQALWKSEQEYARQIEAEADRPRREFETAKNEFKAAIEKELRSIKYRTTRLQNTEKWWIENYKGKTAQAEVLTARKDLLEFLLDTVRYVSFDPNTCTVFTEEVILAEALADNTYVSGQVQNAAVALAEKFGVSK